MLRKKEFLYVGVYVSALTLGIYSAAHFYKKNSILKIVEYPNPTLRHTSASIDSIDDSVVTLSKNMLSTLRYMAIEGFFLKALVPRGLSAPQVGITKRLIVCGINGEIKTMINPEVLERHGTYTSHEGCISVQKGITRNVERSALVKVRYRTLDDEEKILVAREQNAALLEHEIDHLNGIVNTDQ